MEKKKKHLSERLPASQFIMLSGFFYALMTGLSVTISFFFTRFVPLSGSWSMLYALMSFLPLILTYLGEAFLFKFQFAWVAYKWILASIIAIVAIAFSNMLQGFFLSTGLPILAVIWGFRIVQSAIRGIAQTVVLRQYVKRAWVWMVVPMGITVGIIPLYALLNSLATIFSSSFVTYAISTTLIGGIQGIILAMVMTMLVRHTIKAERQQFDQQTSIDEKYSRLEEINDQPAEFTHVDHQEMSASQ